MADNKGKILIIGGYGAVGKTISMQLGRLYPGKVVVAGRNVIKLNEFVSTFDGKLLPMLLDPTPISFDNTCLQGISLVVMCIDQKNIGFLEACIHQGINYVDISANYSFLSAAQTLHNLAKSKCSAVVLSVGVAPGLTNLMAKRCKTKFPNTEQIDMYIMLGLGEAHGEAAILWTLEQLNTDFNIRVKGNTLPVPSFEDGKTVKFPDEKKERKAFRFNFPDQHTVLTNLGISTASSRLCFDSRIVTFLLAFLKKSGVNRVLNSKVVMDAVIKVLKSFHIGSDCFKLKVEAREQNNHKSVYECSIAGNLQSRITGLVATKVATRLYEDEFEAGVFHIEQLAQCDKIIEELSDEEIVFNETAY